MSNNTFGGFIQFAVTVFWPVLLFVVFWGFGIGFSILAMSAMGSSLAGTIEGLSSFLMTTFVPLSLIWICYRRCLNTSWTSRGWTIYIAWVVLSMCVGYLLTAAVGGMSMAVVEGVAGAGRFLTYFKGAGFLTVIAHVFIVPWVFVSLAILKKTVKM